MHILHSSLCCLFSFPLCIVEASQREGWHTECSSQEETGFFPFQKQLELPELTQTRVHWVGDAIQPSHPLLLPSIFPSIRVFSKESALRIRWLKYWNFSFSINPSNEYSGLISFRIDWFDLLAAQGTLKSLLQHRSSRASIRQRSAFCNYSPTLTSIHDYWKNHSLD